MTNYAASLPNYTPPVTAVVSALFDISGPSKIVRVNGAAGATNTVTQGTGNFGNYPLYLFRRGGTSLPFNGRIYGLTIYDRLLNASQLQQLEQWMNRKTGAY